MAETQIIWTILPFGMTGKQQRVSVVVSPRLKPQDPSEQHLNSFLEFLNWPKTIYDASFSAIAEVPGGIIPLELKLTSNPESNLWKNLFNESTLVEKFKYKDMSKEVNWRSYSVRNILNYIKEYYAKMATESPYELPRLLPWSDAQPDLKDMLKEVHPSLGEKGPYKNFDRFFSKEYEGRIYNNTFESSDHMKCYVPGPNGEYGSPNTGHNVSLRVMNPTWDPEWDKSKIFNSQQEYDLYQADRFYRRTSTADENKKPRPDFNGISDPPTVPDFDFHSILAALMDYPSLMRRLGLVLDFTLSENITAREGRLRLRIKRKDQHEDITPWTAFFAGNGRFITRPRPDDQDHEGGLLNLSKSDDRFRKESKNPFDVYQVDPDGAALKTVNFVALSAQGLVNKSLDTSRSKYGGITYTTGDRQGLAALRSGGLGVSRKERAVQVASNAAAMTQKNDVLESGDITLFAEDVLSGYRVDVRDEKDAIWRSLCLREGKYSLTNDKDYYWAESDEGYVAGASTTSENPDSKDHYLHESLFRWTGWSLCAPRPGKSLMAKQMEEVDGSHIQSEVMVNEDELVQNINGCGVKVKFTPKKGSLPRLRFGHLYRLRARIVDLAGNSLARNDSSLNDTDASNAVGYWRFEPIDPPVIVHKTRVSEGESLERMVIRSNYDTPTSEYIHSELFRKAIQPPDPLVPWDFEYYAVNERHFVPPKSSQMQCETHGMFDNCFGGDCNSIKDAYAIAAREEGTLYDGLSDEGPIKLITPSAIKEIATTDGKPALPSPENPVGDRMAGGQYVIHGEEQIVTPWLPDVASMGTAIRAAEGHTLPGVNEDFLASPEAIGERLGGPSSSCRIEKMSNGKPVILVKNGEEWPRSKGFRLILAERKTTSIDPSLHVEDFSDNGAPKWDENKRELTFFVPKGRIVRLLYSSFADKDFIHDNFGIPKWAEAYRSEFIEIFNRLPLDTEGHMAFDYGSAALGANWLITPFRELTLVHATQAPLFEPKFNDLQLKREPGSHDVTLFDKGIELHGPSTGKFEIEANWSEWVDDLTKDAPERVDFKGQLGEIKLAENHINTILYLAEAVDAQLPPPPDTNASAKPQQRPDVHALGDTRFRLIDYRIRATTRFREYLPPSIYEEPEDKPEEILKHVTQLGPVATNDDMLPTPPREDMGAPIISGAPINPDLGKKTFVPASAPPDDPKVLYVVPTMRWHKPENEQANVHNVTRYGNGLRVWLDRPWFSSGDGELLGVVIFKNDYYKEGLFENIPDDFQQLVTQWGADPFWLGPSQTPQAKDTKKDFPAQVLSETIELQEKPGTLVTIVGHRVHWDGTRKLWYCDIELDPLTTYMPFVRLALVRYQPNALPKAKISKVVLTDFAQVLPRRHATVKIEGDKITAALYGPAPIKGPINREYSQEPGKNRVELVLQTRPTWMKDSDLGWEDTEIPPYIHERTVLYPDKDKFTVIEQLKDSTISVETNTGRIVQLDQMIDLGRLQTSDSNTIQKEVVAGNILDAPPRQYYLERPFWETIEMLPKATTNKDRRLIIREYECFLKDVSTLPKERLVFADIIDLPIS